MTTKTTESVACACGCGVAVNPGRTYRQGHDARHKCMLLRAAINDGDADAAKLLVKRGWYTNAVLKERRAAAEAKALPPTGEGK